jgi:hypothetical protein
MKRLLLLCVVIAAALAGTSAGVWLAHPEPTLAAGTGSGTPRPSEPLYIPDEGANLGDVWEASDATLHVPIANRAEHPIEVIDVQTSCDCADAWPRRFTVPPRDAISVYVTIDLSRRSLRQVGMARRPFTAVVTPVTAAGPALGSFTVRGVAVSRVTVNHLAVNFGDSNAAGRPPLSRKVIVTAHVPADRVVASSESDAVAMAVARLSDGRYQLTLTPNTARPAGPFAAVVRVAVVTPDGDVLPGTAVPVEGILAVE